MRWILLTVILLVMPSVYAFNENATLDDYPVFLFGGSGPDIYFNSKIVVGSGKDVKESSAANYLANRLPKDYIFEFELFDSLNNKVVKTRARVPEKQFEDVIIPDAGVEDIYKINAIVIGTPCSNKFIASILQILPENCRDYFGLGEGIIKLIIYKYHTIILIAGDSGNTIFEVTKYFHEKMIDPRSKLNEAKELKINLKSIGKMPIETSQKKLRIGETIGSVTPSLYYTQVEKQKIIKQRIELQKQTKELRNNQEEIKKIVKNIKKTLSSFLFF